MTFTDSRTATTSMAAPHRLSPLLLSRSSPSLGDQNEKGHDALAAAIMSGRLVAETGL